MKFAIVKVINGNYFIHTEGITNINSARVQYHDVCRTLWNSADVNTACVMIVNEQLNVVDNYKERITHDQVEKTEVT